MEQERQKKLFMMRVVIGSVAFIILILWAFNLKNVWQNSRNKNESSAQWLNLKKELAKTLDETQVKLNKIEEDKAAAKKKAGNEFLSGLLEKTEKNSAAGATTANLPSDAATSSPIVPATSTPNIGRIASTTKPSANCPQYIDCMPTFDQANPCIVLPGCEGITMIVY